MCPILAFGSLRDLPQAEAYFKQALHHRPGYGDAANNLALVLAARGDLAGAIAALEHLIETNPSFKPAYTTLAGLKERPGWPLKALFGTFPPIPEQFGKS